ncbi:MAG TPA: hypothetical protein VNY36_02895 [Bacteroidia bacterium]|jgi:hypothetical protein|nr:hypothetical protein [Bacteroidia bacterium]
MKTFALLLFLLGSVSFANAQQDTINRLDSAGKKNGTWVVYYNSFLKQVKDTNKATYYSYTFYVHGSDLFINAPAGRKKWKMVDAGIESEHKGKLKELNGEYRWIDKKGIARVITDYKKGYCTVMKSYFPSGALADAWDFLLQWHCQPHSSTYYVFNKNGEIKETYYFCKDKDYAKYSNQNGWLLVGGSDGCVVEIDTINRTDTLSSLTKLDVAGKMNGRFRVYYDSNLIKIKDSSKAYYYGYADYRNGFKLSMNPGIGTNFNLIYAQGNAPQKGKIRALDGEFKWVDKTTGKPMLISNYKAGYCILYERFSFTTGKIRYKDDFTLKYKGMPNSYCYIEYDAAGNPTRHWMRVYDGNIK